jgi:hypothetical protein
MSEKRITKGWTHFGSNNLDIHNAKSRAERVKADKIANNLIRNVKTLSVEDLVKEKREAATIAVSAKQKREKAIADGKLKDKKKKRTK